MLTRICTFTVGDRHDIIARTHHALLSALAWAPTGTEVALVTDRPERYGWLASRVRLLSIDAATLKAWHGRHDFLWRAKMQSIIHTAEAGPANILYIDSDVLVRKPLDELCAALDAGDTFMHLAEKDLARASRSGDRKMWAGLKGRSVSGLTFTAPCWMWNAGVIAVGSQRTDLLRRAMTILDGLNDGGFHHYFAEQMAVSAALVEGGRLRAAEPWITHYWGNKPGYQPHIDEQLATFLYRGLDVDAAAAWIREHPIDLPAVVRRRWWQKHLRTLAGC